MEIIIKFLSDYNQFEQDGWNITIKNNDTPNLIYRDFPIFLTQWPIYNKWDIASNSFDIQNAYLIIRDDFFKGVLYDLNKEEYSNYAKILFLAIEDALS